MCPSALRSAHSEQNQQQLSPHRQLGIQELWVSRSHSERKELLGRFLESAGEDSRLLSPCFIVLFCCC